MHASRIRPFSSSCCVTQVFTCFLYPTVPNRRGFVLREAGLNPAALSLDAGAMNRRRVSDFGLADGPRISSCPKEMFANVLELLWECFQEYARIFNRVFPYLAFIGLVLVASHQSDRIDELTKRISELESKMSPQSKGKGLYEDFQQWKERQKPQ